MRPRDWAYATLAALLLVLAFFVKGHSVAVVLCWVAIGIFGVIRHEITRETYPPTKEPRC